MILKYKYCSVHSSPHSTLSPSAKMRAKEKRKLNPRFEQLGQSLEGYFGTILSISVHTIKEFNNRV